VDIGNLVQANSSQGIATIQQIRPIAVVFTLAEQDLPQVQAAMAQGNLPALAYTSDGKTELSSGTLLTPNNTITTSTGTIALKAEFPNEDRKLWPGQFVDAHLRLRVQQNALTLPIRALQHGPDGLYIYRVNPDSRVSQQTVTVGYQDDGVAVITSGVEAGQEVVLSGQSRLQDGTKVSPKPATPAMASAAPPA
jgi:multidrug efflux system membrane fusion protein